MFVSSMLAGVLLFALEVTASDNGLARTPQMGWDNWNAFACDVSEDLLLGTAQKIVEYGLKDVGYHYVVLDDCWSAGRTSNGTLIANSAKFPNGMADVADKLHSMGLGFGMYSSAGTYTCGRYAGSLGYEEIDAKTFASWGVDYLKYDNCFNEGQTGTPLVTYNRYKKMSDALNATGRPILYSMCNWGEDYPWKWAQTIANSWRMSGDITDSFDRVDTRCPCSGEEGYNCALPGFHCSMINILNKVTSYVNGGQPGSWNDLDMLEVGNGGMTDTEYITHFTMWAAVKSPLIMGNDIRAMTTQTLTILTNPAILAISQDPAGSPAVRRWRYFLNDTLTDQETNKTQTVPAELQMWSGTLSNGDYLTILLNAGSTPRQMSATLADIFVDFGGAKSAEAQSTWDLYDLWANRMPESIAASIITNNSTVGANITGVYYNATQKSYAEGISVNDAVLMGKMVGSVNGRGSVSAMVEPHGVIAYRMKLRGRSLRKRDEL